MKPLTVSVRGTRVGSLVQDRLEGHYFEPDGAWLRNGQNPILGIYYRQNLGRRPSVARSSHLPVWFENLLPEKDSELRRLLCEALGLRPGQSFSLLASLGRDLPGAVTVSPAEGGESEFLEIEERKSATGPLRFSSLAGAQLKFSMAKQATSFTLPASAGDGKWIVKVPPPDMPLLPDIENSTMHWAGAAGLDTPECEVVPISQVEGLDDVLRQGTGTVFAIRRFDRPSDGDRVHQEDFAQVFNLAPEHKYGDSGPTRATMASVAKVVRDACEPAALQDLLNRFAFVLASGNTDAHLKNWSFVYPNDALIPKLSPCYDQVCTVACDPTRFGWDQLKGPSLGLRFGSAKAFRQVTIFALKELLGKLVTPPDTLAATFLESLIRSRDAWSQVADHAPLAMHEALAQHWKNVPLLAHVGGWKQ